MEGNCTMRENIGTEGGKHSADLGIHQGLPEEVTVAPSASLMPPPTTTPLAHCAPQWPLTVLGT